MPQAPGLPGRLDDLGELRPAIRDAGQIGAMPTPA